MAMVVVVKNCFGTIVEWEVGSVGMQCPWLVVSGCLNWGPRSGSHGCRCVYNVAEVWRSEIRDCLGWYLHT